MMLGDNPVGRFLHRLFPRLKIRIPLETVGRVLAGVALEHPRLRGAALEAVAIKLLVEQFGEERRPEVLAAVDQVRGEP